MNRGFPAYGEVDGDGDYIEDYEEMPAFVKKDWFKPANVSLAQLDKVKPVATVYNLGLRDPRDLQTGRGKAAPVSVAEKISELHTEPPLSTVSYQKAAWGSQNSIPELLKQAAQAGTRPTRPSSAKTGQVSKLTQGRKPRPQSAKDPLCLPGKKKPASTSTFGVKGHKFDPTEPAGKHGMPASGTCVGWAGPPAGLCDPSHDITINFAQPFSADLKKSNLPPPPPNTSPEPEEQDDTIDKAQHYSPPPSPALCLSLSLPSADVDASDDLDTDRLMAEANNYVKTQKKKASQKLKYFKADKHTSHRAHKAPTSSPRSPTQKPVYEYETTSPGRDGIVNNNSDKHQKSTPEDNWFEDILESDREELLAPNTGNGIETGFTSKEDLADGFPTVDLSLDLEGVIEDLDEGTESERALPPSNGFDLKYLGPAKQEKKTRSHPIFLMPDEKSQLQKDTKSSAHGTKTNKSQNVENKQESNSRERETAGQHKGGVHSTCSRSGVHIREDRNITVDITPRNIGRKVTGRSLKKHKSPDSCADSDMKTEPSGKSKAGDDVPDLEITAVKTQSASALGRYSTTPVSVVYDDDDDIESSSEKMKKRKRRGPMKEKDLVTMVSNLAMCDDDGGDEDDPSQEVDIEVGDNRTDHRSEETRSASVLSKGERNYYDIGRRNTKAGGKEDPTGSEEKENFITMTTKTLLFDLERPKESVVKTILDAPVNKTRDHAVSATPDKLHLRPKSANRPRSAKLTKSKLQTVTPVATLTPSHEDDGNEDGGFTSPPSHHPQPDEERPGSRMGFVRMGTDDSVKSDGEEISCRADVKESPRTGLRQRPPSGKRRPLSASKTVNKPSAFSKGHQQSGLTKRRPQSATSITSQTPSAADVQRANAAVHALRSEKQAAAKSSSSAASRFTESRRHYASYTTSSGSGRRNRAKSASLTPSPVCVNSKNPDLEVEDTEAMEECREIQNRLACYGIDVKPQTLERALFPPSGKTLHYQIDAQLPKSFSHGLLSHPRYWLPEEHRKLKLAEKKLAMAELSLWRQKKEEERKAHLAAGKEKGTKKGKKKGKKKLRRSQSLC